MATIQRPVKEGSVRTYQEKVGLGYLDILASEMDADLATIFDAWNGGIDSVTLKDNAVTTAKIGDGQVTYAKLASDARLWEDAGTTIGLRPGPSFVNRPITLTAVNGSQIFLASSGGTLKGIVDVPNSGEFNLYINNAFAPQDTAKSSWILKMDPTNDLFGVLRRAPGGAAGAVSTLLQLANNGSLTLTGGTIDGHLRVGTTTAKEHCFRASGFTGGGLGFNIVTVNNVWTRDDAALGAGAFYYSESSATFEWDTFTAAGALAAWMTYNSAGTFQISGSTAYKATGTLWANPSDRRLKESIEDYSTSLAAICQLTPRTFIYNGKGGSQAGMRGYGFIADEVEPVMPDMIGTRAGKLNPDDEEETDIQTLDQSNLVLALVNAVRELAARVDALEVPA